MLFLIYFSLWSLRHTTFNISFRISVLSLQKVLFFRNCYLKSSGLSVNYSKQEILRWVHHTCYIYVTDIHSRLGALYWATGDCDRTLGLLSTYSRVLNPEKEFTKISLLVWCCNALVSLNPWEVVTKLWTETANKQSPMNTIYHVQRASWPSISITEECLK